MKPFFRILGIAILLIIIAFFLIFGEFFFAIIFGGKVEIANQTNETFSGKIEFFQHKNFLGSENFEILQNEKRKFSVPDDFNDGEIKILIENENTKQGFALQEDYLYSFNVNEKIIITKENETLQLKNPHK